MKLLTIIFFFSLLLGQFGGIQYSPGITFFLHDIVAVVLIIVFLIRQLHRKKMITGSLIQSILLFISMSIISLLLNVAHFSYTQLLLGSFYLWRFVLYTSLYLIVKNETISERWWLKGLYSTGVGIAFLGIVQYIFYPSLRNLLYQGWDEHYYRLFSTLLDPNFAGLFLVLAFFLGIYLYSEKWKPLMISCQLLLGIALVLTYSRSSFVAFGIGIAVLAYLTKQKMLLLSLIFGALLYIGLPTHGIDVNRLFRSESTVARIGSYSESFTLVQKSPIVGIGFNMLRYQASRERMLDQNGITSRDAGGLDSSFLVVLVTTGIIGFVIFLRLLYQMVIGMRKQDNLISAVGLASFTAIVIHSFFNNSFFYAWILIWLWILVGSIEKKNGLLKKNVKSI